MEATLGWRNAKCLRTTVRISLSVFPLPSMGVTGVFIAGGSPNHRPNYTVVPPNCYILGIFLGQLRTFTILHGGQGGPPLPIPRVQQATPAQRGFASRFFVQLRFAPSRSASLRASSPWPKVASPIVAPRDRGSSKKDPGFDSNRRAHARSTTLRPLLVRG